MRVLEAGKGAGALAPTTAGKGRSPCWHAAARTTTQSAGPCLGLLECTGRLLPLTFALQEHRITVR
jgi:hypothetical protein